MINLIISTHGNLYNGAHGNPKIKNNCIVSYFTQFIVSIQIFAIHINKIHLHTHTIHTQHT